MKLVKSSFYVDGSKAHNLYEASEGEAIEALRKMGFLALFLIQGTETCPAGQVLTCDYRAFEGPTAWAIAVYSPDGEKLRVRINVPK